MEEIKGQNEDKKKLPLWFKAAIATIIIASMLLAVIVYTGS